MRKVKKHLYRLWNLSAFSLWLHSCVTVFWWQCHHTLCSGALGYTAFDGSLFFSNLCSITITIYLQLFSWACCHHTQYIWTFLKLLLRSMDKLKTMLLQLCGYVSIAIVGHKESFSHFIVILWVLWQCAPISTSSTEQKYYRLSKFHLVKSLIILIAYLLLFPPGFWLYSILDNLLV